MKILWCILFAGVTAALTLVVRIPIPGTGGYLNLGDMAVVFCGLYLGGKWGGLAGGIGSAAADVIGGFFVFAPVTLIAKGLEGFIAGTLGRKNLLWLILAAGVMVIGYFVAEVFLPGMGIVPALSELPFNLIQAVVGAIGGIALYRGVKLALPEAKK
jgi:uncharacterized membrane protein